MGRFIAFLLLILSSFPVLAQTDNPVVIIYEASGKKEDLAFIDMARRGAEQARNELGLEYEEHMLKPGEDRRKVFERYAKNGKKLVIGLGFQSVSTVAGIANTFPQTEFTVIDGVVPDVFKNVQSVVFRDNEGAFLVGMIAALNSHTGTIGFIGGMDVPVIRDFAYGYQQGARYARPDIRIQQYMIGKTKEAFSDPETAAKLAREQINNGADVLFAAAGGSAVGMLETAAQFDHVRAIGIDTNQNDLFPGTMLTSLVKRVDLAVYNAMKESNLNTWKPGIQRLGIREGALDYAVDVHNRKLLTAATVDRVERAKDFMLRGLLQVDAYKE